MNLAEVYILAERPIGLEFEGIAFQLEERLVGLAKEIYVGEVTLEFTLEEGSLIERAKVVGKGLLVAGTIISSYHGLRESVIDIYRDAQEFGKIAAKQFLEITQTPKSAVQIKRSVPPDLERLRRIVQNADILQDMTLNTSDRSLRGRAIITDIAGLSVSSRQEEATLSLLLHLPWQKLPGLPDTIADVLNEIERRRKAEKEKRLSTPQPAFDRAPKRARRKYSHKTKL